MFFFFVLFFEVCVKIVSRIIYTVLFPLRWKHVCGDKSLEGAQGEREGPSGLAELWAVFFTV